MDINGSDYTPNIAQICTDYNFQACDKKDEYINKIDTNSKKFIGEPKYIDLIICNRLKSGKCVSKMFNVFIPRTIDVKSCDVLESQNLKDVCIQKVNSINKANLAQEQKFKKEAGIRKAKVIQKEKIYYTSIFVLLALLAIGLRRKFYLNFKYILGYIGLMLSLGMVLEIESAIIWNLLFNPISLSFMFAFEGLVGDAVSMVIYPVLSGIVYFIVGLQLDLIIQKKKLWPILVLIAIGILHFFAFLIVAAMGGA